MLSPVKNGSFNPSANSLAKTQTPKNGVSQPFPSNSQPLQNITNTNRSVPSPSGNGWTLGSTLDPRVNTAIPNSASKPYVPPVNQPQAVQTTAKTAGTVGSTIGKFSGAVSAPFMFYDLGTRIGDTTGFFANYGQTIKNVFEKERLDRLTKKQYENALLARQKAQPATTKGNTTITSTILGYNALVEMTFTNEQTFYCWGGNPARSIEELATGKPLYPQITGARYEKQGGITNYYFATTTGEVLGGYFFNRFGSFDQLDTINFRVLGIVPVYDLQTSGTPDTTYEQPKDMKPNRPEKVDANDPRSPNFFPWLPVVQVGSDPKIAYKPSDSPAFDNRPFKEPDSPLQFAPPPVVQPKPVVPPIKGLSSNSSEQPKAPTSRPSVGSGSLVGSNSVSYGAFQAKPFVSGVSDPKEQYDPVDANTGLTYSEFTARNQALSNANALKAKQFDAKEAEKQLSALSTTPLESLGNKSPQQVERARYLNSISTDPERVAAYDQIQQSAKKTNSKTETPVATNQATTADAAKILGGLAAIAGTVTALKIGSDLLVNNSLPKINQIAANTTPTAQQTNAKQGVCDAMQPQQCGYEGVKQATTEATNPIKDQTVANAGLLGQILAAIANLASTIANLFSNVVGKLDGIKTFLEKVASAAKLDKIYNLLTFITVVHNAQMLSTSLATTLMDTLSLGLATFGIKDENDSPIDIQQIINKSTEDTVKSIIGAENYTTLSDRWKKAVRVYQAAANITYQVRSLWDSAKSLAELTGANVGKIGNALRRDGVVSENAYGAMADNPLMVNSAMTKLQNLEEAASHLNAITSETYGITETVTQIKKDQDDFKKLAKEGTSSLNPIVNDQQKAKDDAAKIASVSPSISTTDLSKP